MTSTPETHCWLLGNILVTAVAEGGETAITMTCTTATPIDTVRAALATLATALQAAASERRDLTQISRSGIVDNKAVTP
jgi:hypothetical protein